MVIIMVMRKDKVMVTVNNDFNDNEKSQGNDKGNDSNTLNGD